MSSHTVIAVENLGKLYNLKHRADPQRYVALRDVLSDKLKRMFYPRSRSSDKSSRTETFWALRSLNFEIKQGDVVGVVGRNGAGKSTLLKILSRITEPSEGQVRIKGRVASLLEVGTGFHPELTGRENILLNGAILGMKRAEIRQKFDEIVAFAEVEKFLDTPVKHYSSGMYVRLAFAVAAHLEPEILVIDEVLAVGDSQFQKKCLGKMEEVSKGGRTVLFVSHNMAAVQSLCGTGLLLESGKLCAAGPINDIMQRYASNLRQAGSIDDHNAIHLGPTLRLNGLYTEPSQVQSGSPMSIHLQFVASRPTTIRELVVLIYSELGIRVAALDLRYQGITNLRVGSETVRLETNIPSTVLVEGDYRLGIYVSTTDHSGNFLDLAAFTVLAEPSESDIIPYPPQYRGLVDIGFTVNKEVACS